MMAVFLLYWKQIAGALIGVAILIAIATAFYSYKATKTENVTLKAENATLTALAKQQEEGIVRLQEYAKKKEQRQAKTITKVVKVLALEAKRDEEGNIADDDPILGTINGMFGPDADNKADTPANPDMRSEANHSPSEVLNVWK